MFGRVLEYSNRVACSRCPPPPAKLPRNPCRMRAGDRWGKREWAAAAVLLIGSLHLFWTPFYFVPGLPHVMLMTGPFFVPGLKHFMLVDRRSLFCIRIATCYACVETGPCFCTRVTTCCTRRPQSASTHAEAPPPPQALPASLACPCSAGVAFFKALQREAFTHMDELLAAAGGRSTPHYL